MGAPERTLQLAVASWYAKREVVGSSLRGVMITERGEIYARLQAISNILQLPVAVFFDKPQTGELASGVECMRLWSELKTDESRNRALDALRRIARE